MPLGLFTKWWRAAAAVALAGGLVLIYLAWPQKVEQGPAFSLPSPNGYTDLLSAAAKVPPRTGDYADWSHEQLTAFVLTNIATLDEARLALTRQCQVPTEYYRAYSIRHLPELSAIKSLAQLFSAAGRWADLEGRPSDAATTYLEIVHLGQESARGGVLIDLLVGIACADVGLSKLERIVDRLDLKSAQLALRTLGELETNRPPIEAVLRNEEEWERRVVTIRERVLSFWASKSLNPSRQPIQRAISRINAGIRRHRVLILQLAARAFEIQNGSKPDTVEQLVPAFLGTLPKDPVTGTNLDLFTPSR